MRRLHLTLLTILALCPMACNDEFDGFENPSSPSPVTLPRGSMRAAVNGVAWNADDAVEARIGPPNFLMVSATDKHAWSGSFYLNNFTLGTQTLVQKSGACSFSNATGNFSSTDGSVTITTLTTTSVAGTFDCGTLNRSDDGGGPRTMTVTNGAFDIKF